MKRREALEVYRKSRESAPRESGNSTVPLELESAPSIRPVTDDPVAHAVRHYERWISADSTRELLEYYACLPVATQRQKVLTWAVGKARTGDLHPLLTIGLDDTEPAVRKHLNRLLETIPAEILLSRIAEERFTIRERRGVAGLLGRCKDSRAGRLLASMADHEDSRVRESALEALALFPVTEGLQFPIFKRRLEEDVHPDVQIRAAEGLARLGTPAALAAVEKAARRDDAPPDIQTILAAFQARRRPRQDSDQVSEASRRPKRKPLPKDAVAKLAFVALALAIAAYQLSEPVKRWYSKKFPQPVEQTAAAPN